MIDEFFDDPDYIAPVKEKVQEPDDESPQEQKKTMFEIMSTVVNKKFWPKPEEIDSINSFMMCRYLSNDPVGVQLANWVDHYASTLGSKFPMGAQYRFLRYSISDKIGYIKFPKKEKVAEAETIDLIQKHYKINEQTAVEYLKMIPESVVDELIDKYTKTGRLDGKKTPTKRKRK